MRPLVILRPEPGASATAQSARALGLTAITSPLFEVEPLDWTAPDPVQFDAVLFTSANAVRAGGNGLHRFRALPAHCVGEVTAAEARQAGFDVASVGTHGVESLLASLSPELCLVHFCGADRSAGDAIRQRVTPIPVYRAVESSQPQALDSLQGAVIALHSPRAAACFAKLIDSSGLARATMALAALSDAVAEAAGAGWERVEVASNPADPALLAIASRLCNKPG